MDTETMEKQKREKIQKARAKKRKNQKQLKKKKLIVLDLNGILADIVFAPLEGYTPFASIPSRAVFKRPHCDDFLAFCFEHFTVGVWSSRKRDSVDSAVEVIFGKWRQKLLFIWSQVECTAAIDHITNENFTALENCNKPLLLKELKKIWGRLVGKSRWQKGNYDESNTLLIDDSPAKALRNPANTAIFPASYSYTNTQDNSLGPGGEIRDYLEMLAYADNVQHFVKVNKFNDTLIDDTHPFWYYYKQIKESVARNKGETTEKDWANEDEESQMKHLVKLEKKKRKKLID